VKEGAWGRLENAERANRGAISVGSGFSAVRKEMRTMHGLAGKSLLAHAYRKDTGGSTIPLPSIILLGAGRCRGKGGRRITGP
jgi:hypothetical protein